MEQFKVIGYYVCETKDSPEWLRGISKKVLSVSGCIGEQHPKWESFMGGLRKAERREYQNILKMSDGQYEEFSETAVRLFTQKKIDIDSRFLHFSDARDFCERYSFDLPCRIVSISTTSEYFAVLAEELKDSNCSMSGEIDDSLCLGSDILGWDISGFHSFLCNSLQKELPDARFNEIGLLENDFCQVARFAKIIEGQGEPVVWVPCRVGRRE